VTVAPPTFTEVDTHDPTDAGLSTGEYAGIVIGVLVAFIVLGALVFLLFKRRSEEESAQSAVHTSQV
jgi:flagellar biosynthesis/type III secretory pathway M-ring protein FliF/YscJ